MKSSTSRSMITWQRSRCQSCTSGPVVVLASSASTPRRYWAALTSAFTSSTSVQWRKGSRILGTRIFSWPTRPKILSGSRFSTGLRAIEPIGVSREALLNSPGVSIHRGVPTRDDQPRSVSPRWMRKEHWSPYGQSSAESRLFDANKGGDHEKSTRIIPTPRAGRNDGRSRRKRRKPMEYPEYPYFPLGAGGHHDEPCRIVQVVFCQKEFPSRRCGAACLGFGGPRKPPASKRSSVRRYYDLRHCSGRPGLP